MSFFRTIPEGWSLTTLNQLGEVNRGRSRHRPRDASHLYNGPYPFIQTGDVKASNGRINTFSQSYSEAGLAQSRLWPKKTMCITIAANIAETGILSFPACFPDSVIGFVADKCKCNIYFIEYIFRLLRKSIQAQATGTVQDNINLQTLEKIEFPIPDLETQNKIARILNTFEDKIALNRQINQTLEAMAQALFKSWFVDFEPVRAKLAALETGEDPTLAAMRAISGKTDDELATWQSTDPDAYAQLHTTASLFPDALVDSELGLVPEGWEVGVLSQICESVRKSVQPKDVAPFTPYIGLEHIPRKSLAIAEWGISNDVESQKSSYKMRDILFGKLRPYFHKVAIAPNDGICSTDILVIRQLEPAYYSLMTNYLFSDEMISYVSVLADGTRMPRIDWKSIAKYKIIIPPKETLTYFENSVYSIYQKLMNVIFENRTLATLRDTLLPKLLSGELTVADREMVAQIA